MKNIFIILFITITLFADSDKSYSKLHLPRDLSFLNLNKNQTNILKNILKHHRKELKKLHSLEETWESNLKLDFKKDKFIKDEFIKKSLKLKKSVIDVEANFFKKIHSILNKEQRKKFIEYIEEWEVD